MSLFVTFDTFEGVENLFNQILLSYLIILTVKSKLNVPQDFFKSEPHSKKKDRQKHLLSLWSNLEKIVAPNYIAFSSNSEVFFYLSKEQFFLKKSQVRNHFG